MNMQHPFASLRTALSDERLEGYRIAQTDTELTLFTRYTWNMELSGALYPALHGLEITLRNNMHQAITAQMGNPLWFDLTPVVLAPQEVNKVLAAKQELVKPRKPPEAGRLVAELNFGFWTSLLNSRYEGVFWPRLLVTVFPGMPKLIQKRKVLSTRLNDIQGLRNRVFRHEPIWRYPNLGQRHTELLEAITWLNPALREAIQLVDRFPEIYQNGLTSIEQKLTAFLNAKGYT